MIRIFVGCAANNEDLESQAVLEWSLRKHTKRELSITWMQLSRDRTSPWYSNDGHGWATRFWTTPFSGFRWAVPEQCDWQGQAIYSDSDVIFLADIGELWDQPFEPGKIVIAKGGQRYCVAKWDCAAAKRHLPAMSKLRSDPYIHRGLMGRFAALPQVVQTFAKDADWNRLDLEPFELRERALKAVHYTGIPTQPQLRHAVPRLAKEGGRHWYSGPRREHPRHDLVRLFDQLLVEAISNGYGIERYRKPPFGPYEIRAGH